MKSKNIYLELLRVRKSDITKRDFKICTTIFAGSIDKAQRLAEIALNSGSDLVELRLDYLSHISVKDIDKFFSPYLDKTILTLRSAREGGLFTGNSKEYREVLEEILELKPAYLDIEIKSINDSFKRGEYANHIIASFHDTSKTPSLRFLERIRNSASKYGIVKIVTRKKDEEDENKITSLYKGDIVNLIAFLVGKEGRKSRFRSLMLGAPIGYAALVKTKHSEVLGQPTLEELIEFRRLLRDC